MSPSGTKRITGRVPYHVSVSVLLQMVTNASLPLILKAVRIDFAVLIVFCDVYSVPQAGAPPLMRTKRKTRNCNLSQSESHELAATTSTLLLGVTK
jgi:hypothetical protein